MAGGPSIYLGQTGATGGVTGPHGHFEVFKGDKRYPLSQTRSDLGQKIQFRLPGTQAWQQMYRQGSGGQFQLNPVLQLTGGMGIRAVHPVTGAHNVAHRGEDYNFPEGTDLRFMGGGNVEGLVNVGRAGNISRLRTGPYQLDVFHMLKAPNAASVMESASLPPVPTLPAPPGTLQTRTTPAAEPKNTRTEDIIEAFMYGKQYQEPQKERSLEDTLKGELLTGALTNALAPKKSFLSSFINQQPYLMGQAASTSNYLSGYPL
jgi:hypothetical protein